MRFNSGGIQHPAAGRERRLRSVWLSVVMTAVGLSAGGTLAAQQDDDGPDDDGPVHGVLARYQVGESIVARVEQRVAFDQRSLITDPRLAAGPITRVQWSGTILIRDPSPVRFSADVAGELSLRIDGATVLESSPTADRSMIEGDLVALSPGDHQCEVEYRPSQNGRLRLFWTSSSFTLEPIAADVFSLTEVPSEPAMQQRGLRLADAYRCRACHHQLSSVSPVAAPALDRINDGHTDEWLIARLRRPSDVVANSRMPAFSLTEAQAREVAAFLLSVSKPSRKPVSLSFEQEDVAAGRLLLNSAGCAACHQTGVGGPATAVPAAPYEGPELVSLHRRRTAAWVDRWLRDPGSLNADHRMPVFDLSSDERRQLVAALCDGGEPAKSGSAADQSGDLIAAGRALVQSLNCAGCHAVPGMKPGDSLPITGPHAALEHTCLAPSRDTLKSAQPQFHFSDADREAILAWVSAQAGAPSVAPQEAAGPMLLQRNGCVACHDRGVSRGLSAIAASLESTHPDLRGMSQGMIPPALTAVGDKLQDDDLMDAVAGDQKLRRLPWLLVRMPKFRHSPGERTELTRFLIAADRIPDEADALRQDVLADFRAGQNREVTEAELLTANQLTGAGGFNCVACHSAGAFEPRNVALGTRGSDMMTMGSRLRSRFFLRWMKNPIRVVPGIEMPAIRKAAPGVLDESLPAQIALIWRALQDERFTPPTVTSRFEQFLTVAPSNPPRVVRDVFTIGEGKDLRAVARAMAIGLSNGHSVLFDLDSLQLMHWTFGDFARQRTEGKSWYWDLAGVTVALPTDKPPQFRATAADGAVLEPVVDEGRAGELLTWNITDNSVEFVMRLHLRSTDVPAPAPPSHPHADYSAWYDPQAPTTAVDLRYRFTVTARDKAAQGWQAELTVINGGPDLTLSITDAFTLADVSSQVQADWEPPLGRSGQVTLRDGDTAIRKVTLDASRIPSTAIPLEPLISDMEAVTSTPGFDGQRLPLDTSLMPTSISLLPGNRLAFTSLKGHVWVASDQDGDGLQDLSSLFAEGLAAPFGILPDGDDLLVAHKPEVVRLSDRDGDGRAEHAEVAAAGWGYSDNYHDWATGLVRDRNGDLFVGLGSDYSDKRRSIDRDRWRGGIVKVDSTGHVSPVAMAFRYPMGLAIDSRGRLFATDNQGVQNPFNEINLIEPGGRYGVASLFDKDDASDHSVPALAVPHPWSRSVNSILFLPDDYPVAALRGHGIGCEYDNRFLIRFTLQDVDGQVQGASYPFSLPDQPAGGTNFIGPICSALGRDGAIYIGSIRDSGWQGGLNTGGITRLLPAAGGLPNGIREVRAVPGGFEVDFFGEADPTWAADEANWSLRSYTRVWSGNYATPDSDERAHRPRRATLTAGHRTVLLEVPELKPGHMYEIFIRPKAGTATALWPDSAYYWMRAVPR